MIPSFVEWLLSQREYRPEQYPLVLSVTTLMHRFGINARHLFLVVQVLCDYHDGSVEASSANGVGAAVTTKTLSAAKNRLRSPKEREKADEEVKEKEKEEEREKKKSLLARLRFRHTRLTMAELKLLVKRWQFVFISEMVCRTLKSEVRKRWRALSDRAKQDVDHPIGKGGEWWGLWCGKEGGRRRERERVGEEGYSIYVIFSLSLSLSLSVFVIGTVVYISLSTHLSISHTSPCFHSTR